MTETQVLDILRHLVTR